MGRGRDDRYEYFFPLGQVYLFQRSQDAPSDSRTYRSTHVRAPSLSSLRCSLACERKRDRLTSAIKTPGPPRPPGATFSSQLEDGGSRFRRYAKSQTIEIFQDRLKPENPALRFRTREDSQRACEGQLQHFGLQSPNWFANDHHGVRNLQSQRQHFLLPCSQVRCGRYVFQSFWATRCRTLSATLSLWSR